MQEQLLYFILPKEKVVERFLTNFPQYNKDYDLVMSVFLAINKGMTIRHIVETMKCDYKLVSRLRNTERWNITEHDLNAIKLKIMYGFDIQCIYSEYGINACTLQFLLNFHNHDVFGMRPYRVNIFGKIHMLWSNLSYIKHRGVKYKFIGTFSSDSVYVRPGGLAYIDAFTNELIITKQSKGLI